jgi:bacteriorhodopsin
MILRGSKKVSLCIHLIMFFNFVNYVGLLSNYGLNVKYELERMWEVNIIANFLK